MVLYLHYPAINKLLETKHRTGNGAISTVYLYLHNGYGI